MQGEGNGCLGGMINATPPPPPTHTHTAEQALKARREIADYIKNKRIERARIRVRGMSGGGEGGGV